MVHNIDFSDDGDGGPGWLLVFAFVLLGIVWVWTRCAS